MIKSIFDNYKNLCKDVKRTAEKCDRSPDDIKIVLVTKYQPVEKINSAIEAGADQLAENYPEMLINKLPEIIDLEKIKWHMIGHIQSRKTNLVLDHFDYVHSIENLKIAQRLENRGNEKNRIITVLLELNLSGEELKNGYRVETPLGYQTFKEDIISISGMAHLKLDGLMVMPPFTTRAEDSRKYFSDFKVIIRQSESRLA